MTRHRKPWDLGMPAFFRPLLADGTPDPNARRRGWYTDEMLAVAFGIEAFVEWCRS